LILGVQTIYMKVAGIAFSGFTTVILLLLIMGSALMISLGIIGNYIAKIFDEVKGRPRYLIREEKRKN
jgi:polyisoprenyl-phosphate glycosyltransferase